MREELDGMIRDRVREEVSYREAIALGLDKDDTIIRRRLRQKWNSSPRTSSRRGSRATMS
jgi:hypothetical protein